MHWTTSITLLLLNALLTHAQEKSVFTQSSNSSLLWGPYRPNLYFGIRPRLPKSLTTGLLWARVEDFNQVQHTIRYTCEQSDDMAGYGWDKYDARTGGVQMIRDKGNGIDLETSFVKFDEGRGGWGARISGEVRDDAPPSPTDPEGDVASTLKMSLWLTLGVEGLGSMEVQGAEAAEELGFDRNVVFEGQTSDLGDFRVTVAGMASEKNFHPGHRHPSYAAKPLENTFVHSVQIPEEALWQGKAITFSSMKTTIENYVEEYTQDKMPPPWQTYTIQNRPGVGNFHILQKVFEGPFSFDVFYTPNTVKHTPTSAELTKQIDKVVKGFDDKYEATTLIPQAPFKGERYDEFSKSLFSNLIGGIGYFHGDQVVDRSYAAEYEEENEGFWEETAEARARNQQALEGPYELFTSIPSRPFFPRGFLWDEGFHLLPVVDFDPELVMQILSSWFGTMDSEGWIPREQILGNEARSKVPQEFQVQYPHYANPPTLFMVLEALLDKAKTEQNDLLKDWLAQLYPLLQRNFDWYRRTQPGDLKSYDRPKTFSTKEAYRWRGRTPSHILTSGLDDYPRAQPPHPGELHLDLISWMGMMSRSLRRVASFLGEREDAGNYAKIYEAIRRNTDDLHWSAEDGAYCDVSIDEFYEESVHVCHKGYISLFPFLTGMLGPEHEHLGEVLDLIGDEGALWSQHGIRSLSKRDALYGTGEDYWRGPVWMNMNYLVVSNLLNIATHPGPQQTRAAQMYCDLRRNLVETVYASWVDTGFAWEQFHPDSGKGQRTQHFTGWTSLVIKVMGMPEDPTKVASRGHDEL